jgi:uncharacterized LabA/DUF88 family protein
LDYRRFRSWIRQKYGTTDAKLFIGLMQKHADLYTKRQAQGYQCVFKEVVYDHNGRAKGNCDADLVVHAMRDYFESGIRSVILVASDGDYTPLVRFWMEKSVRCTVLSPSAINRCSVLLKRTGVPIVTLQDVRTKIEHIK